MKKKIRWVLNFLFFFPILGEVKTTKKVPLKFVKS